MATKSKSSLRRSGSKNASRARSTKTSAILSSRKALLDVYSQKMQLADQQATDITKRLASQIRWVSWSVIAISLLIFLAAISLMIYGFWKLFDAGSNTNILFPISCIGVGLIMLLLVFLRNPISLLENIIQNTARMNMVYLGFVRQVNQIDLAFHDLYSWNVEINPSKLNDMLLSLQSAIDNAASILPEVEDLEG